MEAGGSKFSFTTTTYFTIYQSVITHNGSSGSKIQENFGSFSLLTSAVYGDISAVKLYFFLDNSFILLIFASITVTLLRRVLKY